MNTLTTGEKIAKAATAWLGTPYANNSMVKGAGVDCSYLLVAALVDSGLMKADRLQIENYSNEWHLHHSEEKYLKYVQQVADEVKVHRLKLAILCYINMADVSHTALFISVKG